MHKGCGGLWEGGQSAGNRVSHLVRKSTHWQSFFKFPTNYRKRISDSQDSSDRMETNDVEEGESRAPVVTVMGHVDHGKTTLLDALRRTSIAKREAGGITQHIGAYQVEHKGQKITFIDTPGHAAFTDMRERGANVTDIVVLVVAADDGVKEQTVDSIRCAMKAGVPIVVAVNKIDLKSANPMRVLSELTNHNVLVETLGGEVLSNEISAKSGENLDDLLESILLQAEIQDLKAKTDGKAHAVVLDAWVDRRLGRVATALVKSGTLRVGDHFVAGEAYGKARAIISCDGVTRLKEAVPSQPVRIVGFDVTPAAGDSLDVVDSPQTARLVAESRTR